MSNTTTIIKSVGDAFANIGKNVLNTIQTQGQEFADEIRQYAVDTAKDIERYTKLILETVEKEVNGTISVQDALISIKVWKTSIKSAIKKLEVTTVWEAYNRFIAKIDSIFKVLSLLLEF